MSTVFHDPAGWLSKPNPITLRLPPDVYQIIMELAAEEGRSVEAALEQFIIKLARA